MPKRVYKFQGFYGGINDAFSVRDIAPTQLRSAQDIDVSDYGQIKMMGAEATHADISATVSGKKMIQNTGLFFYSTDRAAGALAAETGDDWILIADIGSTTNTIYKWGLIHDTLATEDISLVGTAKKIVTATSPVANIVIGDFVGNGADFTSVATSVGVVYDVTSTYIVVSLYKTGTSAWANADVIYVGTTLLDTAAVDSTETVSGAPTTWAGAVDFKPVYYAVDGGLRVSNGNFDDTTENKWHGYIKRTHFSNVLPGGTADAYDNWYTTSQKIAPPTRGLFGDISTVIIASATGDASDTLLQATGSFTGWQTEINSGEYVANNETEALTVGIVSWTNANNVVTSALAGGAGDDQWINDAVSIATDPGLGFNVGAVATGTGGSWTAGDYIFASTFIYDNTQESLLYILSGKAVTLAAGEKWTLSFVANSPYSPRITGGRIYCKIDDNDDPWTMIADISLADGARSSLSNKYGEYIPWTILGTGSTVVYSAVQSLLPNSETYDILNGYSPEQQDIDIGGVGMGYKTACVAGNRKAYVAHVKMRDADGKIVVRGDLMLESKANKFDTFLWEDRVEVAINDGDDVTAIVPFADRILQYKKKKLYIINISQDISFLEDQFSFRGVLGVYQTAITEMGVASVNEHGIFLYNGKDLIDLTEDSKIGQKKLNWSSYYSSIANVSIGYIPKKKQLLIITNTADEATLHNVLIYDFRTQSFVKGYQKVGTLTGADNIISNTINDWADNLVYAVIDSAGDNMYFKYWNTAATLVAVANDFVLFTTRSEDFGTPDIKKCAYKVSITHNQTATTTANLALYYSVNDGGTWAQVGTTNFADQSSMAKQDFTFTTIVEDFYTMQFKVAAIPTTGAGNIEAAFAIDEFSVVVRDKVVT